MAEPYRDRDTNAPQNPPNSVVNPEVRRTALWLYLGPIVMLFVVIGVAFVYWTTRPAPRDANADRNIAGAEGTAGGEADRAGTPGGGEKQPMPDSTREEIASRGGEAITELGGVLEEDPRTVEGRRVDVRDVDVERIESPTLFWIRDGNARVAVVTPADPSIQAGRTVNVTGVAERSGDSVRIRATRVEAGK